MNFNKIFSNQNAKELSDVEDADSDAQSYASSGGDDETDYLGGAKKKKASKQIGEEEEDIDEELEKEDDDEDEEDDEDDLDKDEDDEDDLDKDKDEDDEDDDSINSEDLDAMNLETNKKSKKKKNAKKVIETNEFLSDIDYDNEMDNENEEDKYHQKIKQHIKHNTIMLEHPESQFHNYEEIETLSKVVRNKYGQIVDPFHQTSPTMTKYELADILGKRASQINENAPIFVDVDPSVIDGYLIALKELQEKKIPFIIQRPLPNGKMEYWPISELELLIPLN